MELVMERDLRAWLIDAAELFYHDYPDTYHTLEEVGDMLYEFVRDDMECIRDYFGNVTVEALGDIIYDVAFFLAQTHENVDGERFTDGTIKDILNKSDYKIKLPEELFTL